VRTTDASFLATLRPVSLSRNGSEDSVIIVGRVAGEICFLVEFLPFQRGT
jgi:hypothetical protein